MNFFGVFIKNLIKNSIFCIKVVAAAPVFGVARESVRVEDCVCAVVRVFKRCHRAVLGADRGENRGHSEYCEAEDVFSYLRDCYFDIGFLN